MALERELVRCVAMCCCSVLQCALERELVRCVAVCCCSVLQCALEWELVRRVAVCCSVLFNVGSSGIGVGSPYVKYGQIE